MKMAKFLIARMFIYDYSQDIWKDRMIFIRFINLGVY
jgi:hypothetical protein